ncbi:type II toxin-antitoxin system RelE/ParE family toxin [Rhizobium sp. RAF56]|jgi:addiction module RelE/StbE family toxin|uniref:type II toxin-antitoxin system RelE/ParE family toxin n=1 Tax=Rhizobium sp. RAF56 TaxID=3233062 RepID=UPI003F96919F
MKIIWTPQAELDRLEIFQFIASENPAASIRMDQLFARFVERLADFPQLGRPGMVEGTREIIPHRHYRLIYEILGDEIWVLALLHTARQWPPMEA